MSAAAQGADAHEATAPGKLVLAGEYAVLHGEPAVVAAMDRRAVARVGGDGPSSPFLDAVAARLAERLGADHAATRAARAVRVDTSAFSHGGQKLGLGSSAAATVAATAAALSAAGLPWSRNEVFELSRAAHGDAQGQRGARGSGADIAASTWGGVILFRAQGARVDVEPLPVPRSVQWVPFFTGASADTVTLVAHVARAGAAARAGIALAARASAALAQALAQDDAAAILAAVAQGGQAIATLGHDVGYDLETAAVRAARATLSALGAQVKTTGAGGGDLAVAAAPAHLDRNSIEALLIQAGCRPYPLCIDPSGVDLRRPPQ